MIGTLATILVLSACGTDQSAIQPAPIETISQQITFDSVDRLGPHHSIASVQYTETRDEEVSLDSTQTIEIAWNSWDSFHFQRFVDGEPTFEAINHAGQSASRNRRGPWKGALDGEAARLDVYTAWNAWEEALDGFNDRVVFSDPTDTIVDGRPAQQFSVSLGPQSEERRNRTGGMLPHRLEGTVTLDSATAVRLRAEIVAVSKRKNRVRRVQLTVRRTGIGETLAIEPPIVKKRPADEFLRKPPQRPKRP